MRYGALGQNGSVATSDEPRTSNGASTAAAGAVGTKEIPYDYVATFKLLGQRGARVQDVINISTEGTFVAVSVGYSFVTAAAALTQPVTLPTPLDATFKALFPEGALLRASGIQFLYTIVDSASGRELQNKPVHSIAGLGAANGERPFRPFARPFFFLPRATIRIEIEELSEGTLFRDGTLFIVLHGYKRLGE
jgi:hypothetical protein